MHVHSCVTRRYSYFCRRRLYIICAQHIWQADVDMRKPVSILVSVTDIGFTVDHSQNDFWATQQISCPRNGPESHYFWSVCCSRHPSIPYPLPPPQTAPAHDVCIQFFHVVIKYMIGFRDTVDKTRASSI